MGHVPHPPPLQTRAVLGQGTWGQGFSNLPLENSSKTVPSSCPNGLGFPGFHFFPPLVQQVIENHILKLFQNKELP